MTEKKEKCEEEEDNAEAQRTQRMRREERNVWDSGRKSPPLKTKGGAPSRSDGRSIREIEVQERAR